MRLQKRDRATEAGEYLRARECFAAGLERAWGVTTPVTNAGESEATAAASPELLARFRF